MTTAQHVLDALGHSPQVSDTCTARVKPLLPEARKPGPQNPPIFCCLKAGHEGPHRCNHGGTTFPPFPFRESDDVEFREPLAFCMKCRVKWPCADAQKVIAALAAPDDLFPQLELLAIADEMRRQVLRGPTVDWRPNMGALSEKLRAIATETQLTRTRCATCWQTIIADALTGTSCACGGGVPYVSARLALADQADAMGMHGSAAELRALVQTNGEPRTR